MGTPGRAATALAAGYYAIAGAIALLVSMSTAAAAVSAGLDGCVLIVGEAMVRVPGAISEFGCAQRVDVLETLLGLGAGLVLLVTLVWLGSRSTGLRRFVPLGAITALLTGLLPLATVLWLVDFYRLTWGIVEAGLAGVPLAWAILTGWITLAAWRRDRASASTPQDATAALRGTPS
jgi:hypothetical protein